MKKPLPIIGKTIAEVAFNCDPSVPWEVQMAFTDGSRAYIGVEHGQAADLLFAASKDSLPIKRRIPRGLL